MSLVTLDSLQVITYNPTPVFTPPASAPESCIPVNNQSCYQAIRRDEVSHLAFLRVREAAVIPQSVGGLLVQSCHIGP